MKRIQSLGWSVLLLLALAAVERPSPAQEPTRIVFVGDTGNEGVSSGTELKVGQMVKTWGPAFVVAAGDLAYEKTSDKENIFRGDPVKCYGDFIKTPAEDPDGSKTRFYPALGNHEYSFIGGNTDQKRLEQYQQAFALPRLDGALQEGGMHYYEVAKDAVRIFILDSNVEDPGKGYKLTSKQHAWFEKRVNETKEKWKFAVYHHTAWTGGKNHDSGTPPMRAWNFETSGVTASIAGHSHVYERVMKGDFPFFTVGLSGVGAYPFVAKVEGSKARLGKDEPTVQPEPKLKNGALFLEATKEGIVMEFWTIGGQMIDRWPENAVGLQKKPVKP